MWSEQVFDMHPTVAEYIDTESQVVLNPDVPSFGSDWFVKHCRNSKYLLQVLKCKDENCCPKPRSDLRIILPDFLPAPIPIENAGNSIQCNMKGKFLPLFQTLALKSKIPGLYEGINVQLETYETPYDLFCKTVRNTINAHVCKQCKFYFATLHVLKTHIKELHKKNPKEVVKIRPKRVAARRQKELMALLKEDDSAEWYDESDIEDTVLETIGNVTDATQSEESECRFEEFHFVDIDYFNENNE